jgi:hypothetical protein
MLSVAPITRMRGRENLSNFLLATRIQIGRTRLRGSYRSKPMWDSLPRMGGTPLPPRGCGKRFISLASVGTVNQVLPSGRDEAVAGEQTAAIAGRGFESSAVAARSRGWCEGRVQESQRAESRPGPRMECRAREKLCSRLARTELSLLSGSAFCDGEARRFGGAGGTKVPRSVWRREKAWVRSRRRARSGTRSDRIREGASRRNRSRSRADQIVA